MCILKPYCFLQVIQGSFNAGIMNSLNEQESLVYDKFFLGGPISLRGFDFRGLGPKRDNDFIGGNVCLMLKHFYI